MTDCINITLVANAGVLVRTGDRTLLVDGIHDEGGHPFARVVEGDMERMQRGQAPFERLDYLLFTHEHPDHFTPGRVLDLVRHRRVKGLCLPDSLDCSPGQTRLRAYLRAQGIPFRTAGLEPGEFMTFRPEEGLAVTVIGTRHMGPQFQGVRNYCLLLSLSGMNVLFTGDADPMASYYEAAFKGVELDAVFVNPFFYHNPGGQAVIDEIFRPREVVIYHMPPPGHDPLHLEFTVRRALERFGAKRSTRVLGVENPLLELCPVG